MPCRPSRAPIQSCACRASPCCRGRAEILAGVKFGGLLGENLAHGSGHGQTAVRVDVDLAHRALGSLAELLFGDADSVGELAAILIDGVNFVLGYRRRAVEYDGESGELLHNGVEYVECQRRGTSLPSSLRVHCSG